MAVGVEPVGRWEAAVGIVSAANSAAGVDRIVLARCPVSGRWQCWWGQIATRRYAMPDETLRNARRDATQCQTMRRYAMPDDEALQAAAD